MKKLLLLFFSVAAAWSLQAKDLTLVSPDGHLHMVIHVNGELSFVISRDGKEIVSSPALSLELGDRTLPMKNDRIRKTLRTKKDEVLDPVVPVKNSAVRNRYNGLVLQYRGGYDVEFRLFDDGAAYRYVTRFPDSVTVKKETVRFVFPDSTWSYFPREESFFSHNERSYVHLAVEDILPGDLASLPALFEVPGGVKVLLTESDLRDYPGMWITGAKGGGIAGTFPYYPLKTQQKGDRNVKPVERADYMARTAGDRSFPWRVLAIAPHAKDLLENEIVFRLASPCRLDDVSWIKPGLVAWDWWNALNIYGVDFRSGVNTKTYKYFIDFASEYHIPYIILDEGWYKLGNLLDINPDVDLPELFRYAKEKNVGIILWVVWKTLDDQMEEALDKFAEWGVKGIKVDFMQRDDQWMVDYYRRVAEEAAQRHMLVDFHGAYKPAGLRREYPNVISREGVKGLENCKWSDLITPQHNCNLPFIRMVPGPMDYTPGAMINAHKKNYFISWDRPMSMTTRVQQMAMYVVYESPLQMLADNPTNYMKNKECLEFMAQMPTTWDETHALAGEVGTYVAVARRKGDKWYVGAMNGEKARDLTLDLSFLPEGRWQVTLFEDGVNAPRYAQDYRKRVITLSGRSMKIHMDTGGGWVAVFEKQ